MFEIALVLGLVWVSPPDCANDLTGCTVQRNLERQETVPGYTYNSIEACRRALPNAVAAYAAMGPRLKAFTKATAQPDGTVLLRNVATLVCAPVR